VLSDQFLADAFRWLEAGALDRALTHALVEHAIAPHEVRVVTGTGCGSRLHQVMRINGMHTRHGRSCPIAQGAKLANPYGITHYEPSALQAKQPVGSARPDRGDTYAE
jgi:hypothetical protein